MRRYHLLFLLVLSLSAGCKKDTEINTSSTATDYFAQAKADGKTYNFRAMVGGYSLQNYEQRNGQSNLDVTLTTTGLLGAPPILTFRTAKALSGKPETVDIILSDFYIGTFEKYYLFTGASIGKLKVTKVDNLEVEATFEFDTANKEKTIKVIGSFKLKFTS